MVAVEDTTFAKPAPTDLPILDAIRHRWSPRAYAPLPVEEDKLITVLEAGRWAASSYNRQPWRFILARRDDDDAFQAMLDVLGEFNQNWAHNAGVIGVAVAKTVTDDGDPNPHAEHDTGMAMAHMALQATEHGMFLHMMAGFSAEKARETYNIPDGYKPLTAFALGYPGDSDELPEDLQEREDAPRQRLPLDEIVFSGGWDASADFVRNHEQQS